MAVNFLLYRYIHLQFPENGIETAWQRNGAISVKTEISSPKNGGRIPERMAWGEWEDKR